MCDPMLASVLYYKQVSFPRSVESNFFSLLCVFLGDFAVYNGPFTTVPKCCLVFLREEDCGMLHGGTVPVQ